MEKIIYLNEGATSGHLNYAKVTVVAETEKAYKVERMIESKGKAYQVWVPKAALKHAKSGDVEYDETNLFMEKWFEGRLSSFDHWFFTAK